MRDVAAFAMPMMRLSESTNLLHPKVLADQERDSNGEIIKLGLN